VLGVGQIFQFDRTTQPVAQYDIVGRDTGFPTKIVFIQVFVHTYKIGVGSLDGCAAEFIACNPAKRVVEAFVLADAAARYKPKSLCGFVDAVPKQVTAVLVRDNQIDGDQRGGVDRLQEFFDWKHSDVGLPQGGSGQCASLPKKTYPRELWRNSTR
jgi:hypothetical protein